MSEMGFVWKKGLSGDIEPIQILPVIKWIEDPEKKCITLTFLEDIEQDPNGGLIIL
jgi:hypothetical protein